VRPGAATSAYTKKPPPTTLPDPAPPAPHQTVRHHGSQTRIRPEMGGDQRRLRDRARGWERKTGCPPVSSYFKHHRRGRSPPTATPGLRRHNRLHLPACGRSNVGAAYPRTPNEAMPPPPAPHTHRPPRNSKNPRPPIAPSRIPPPRSPGKPEPVSNETASRVERKAGTAGHTSPSHDQRPTLAHLLDGRPEPAHAVHLTGSAPSTPGGVYRVPSNEGQPPHARNTASRPPTH